jgi:hypothetical protein
METKWLLKKKLNIQAGNDYFGKKKDIYKKSLIANVNDLSKYKNDDNDDDDWVKTDIEKREESFLKSIVNFFQSNLNKK